MGVILGRVDERLIHGQMALSWLRQYQVDAVVVIDDKSAADPLQSMLLQMAVSGMVQCVVTSLTDAKEKIQKLGSKKIFLCTKSPDIYVSLLEQGVEIPQINIGGIYSKEGRKQYYKTIFLDDKLKADLLKLEKYPVKVEYRIVPQDGEVDIIKELKEQ